MSESNNIQVIQTDIEGMMHEFRRQQPDRFIGHNDADTSSKVELVLMNGVMFFYGATYADAMSRYNTFIDYCRTKGIDALTCTMIEEGK